MPNCASKSMRAACSPLARANDRSIVETPSVTIPPCSTQEVADSLGISVYTAGDHRDRIYYKLGIHSRAELGRLFTP